MKESCEIEMKKQVWEVELRFIFLKNNRYGSDSQHNCNGCKWWLWILSMFYSIFVLLHCNFVNANPEIKMFQELKYMCRLFQLTRLTRKVIYILLKSPREGGHWGTLKKKQWLSLVHCWSQWERKSELIMFFPFTSSSEMHHDTLPFTSQRRRYVVRCVPDASPSHMHVGRHWHLYLVLCLIVHLWFDGQKSILRPTVNYECILPNVYFLFVYDS